MKKNERKWWANNWDKVVGIVIVLLTAFLAYSTVLNALTNKISKSDARDIVKEEIKINAPSRESFHELKEWMVQQRTEIKHIMENVDWLVKRERERKR